MRDNIKIKIFSKRLFGWWREKEVKYCSIKARLEE